MPPIDFEQKFRESGLDRSDAAPLKAIILNTNSLEMLHSYLYIYGFSFDEDREISSICINYIRNMEPGLTAICMKVIIDFWNHLEDYYDKLQYFLNSDLFEGDWYDEVIFSVVYIRKNRNIVEFPPQILDKFEKLVKYPEIRNLGI